MCSDCKPLVLLKTRTLLAGNARFFFSLKALSMDATGSVPFPKSLCVTVTLCRSGLSGEMCSDCKPLVLLKMRTLLAGNARVFFSLKAPFGMDAKGSVPLAAAHNPPKSPCVTAGG